MTIAPNQPADAQNVLEQLGLKLAKDQNLRDLTNVPLARQHLGLGTFATQNASDVAITGGSINGTPIGAVTPAYGRFSTLEVVGDFTFPATGEFWANDGATVLRVNDRLLVGAATENDANKPPTDIDWLTALVNWPVLNGLAAITSPVGTIALTVGSQTVDLDPIAAGTTQTTIGVAAFAIANNPGTYPSGYFAAYGFYSEARVYPGTVSDAFGAEFEAINMSGVANATPTPYRELQTGSAQALRLGSGGGQGLSPSPAISAIAIVPNGSTFNAGIVFEKGALTGAGGSSGFGNAIIMAKGHLVSWYAVGDGDGERTFFVTSTITDADYRSSIQAQDGAILFIQPNDKTGFSVSTVANAANGIGVKPSVAGSATEIEAFGDDTNIPIKLNPKGSGDLQAWTNSFIFYSDAGNQMSGIVNAVDNAARTTTLTFQNTGAYFYGAGGGLIATFGGVVNSVNYLSLNNAATGNAPEIVVSGSDTNIPLTISSKGAGVITLNAPQTTAVGSFTGGAITATGTLTGQGTTNLGTSLANYITINGAATSGSYGTSTVSTAGTATYSNLMLTTKGVTSVVGTNRPFIQSTHASFDTNAAARGPNTAFLLNNTYTYSSTNFDPRFRVTGNLGGTITGSTFAVNEFTVPTDNLDATSSGGLSGLYMGYNFGGANAKGNRTAITGKVFVTVASPNQNDFRFMTGISGGAYAQYGQGGTGNNYNEQKGYIFGALLQGKLYANAWFSRQAVGLELNVGSVNPILDVHGIQVVRETDAPNGGMRGFAAYGIVDGNEFTGGTGWDFGFTYMLNNGKMPLNYTRGTVLGAPQNEYSAAPTTGYGVDFVELTALQAQFRGTGSNSMIDRYGNIGGQTVGGVALSTRGSIYGRTAVVSTITVVDGSLFLTKPALTVTAPPTSGTQATADINTMAADITYSIAGGTGYTVGEQVTLSGGTYSTQAVYEVAAVSGGVPTRLTPVTPGSYTVLPSNPVSTTSDGSGIGLTVQPWWTALTVTVTNPGSNYPALPLPNVTAEVTKPDRTMTPIRRMMFQVTMTSTRAPIALADNYDNYIVVTGGTTSGSYGAPSISTAGSATYSNLLLTTKDATSVVGTNRPFIQSIHASFGTNAAVRGPNTAFMLNNTYTYSSTNLDPRFRVTGSLAGTITGSTFAVNEFTVPADNLDAVSSGGLSGLYMGYNFGGANAKGNRTAITGKVFVTADTPNQTAFRFMTGLSGGAYADYSQGGTGNHYDEQNGYIFGALLQAKLFDGAHYSRQAAGLELNVGAVNPILDVVGVQVVRELDAPNGGMRGFAAYGIVDGVAFTGGNGWDFGFAYMLNNGKMPLNYTRGTVLGAPQNEYSTSPTAGYGVDFVGLTLLQAQFRGTDSNFIIDRYGNLGGQTVSGVELRTRGDVKAYTAVVNTITVIDGSLFITKPALTVTAPPGSGTQATADIDTMAADILHSLSGGTGYQVGDEIALVGGTYSEQAVYEVAAVSGGVPTRLTLVTPGSYTVLPSNPVATTTDGSGTGLTMTPWWTALTVIVTAPGSNYPTLPPPDVTAAVTDYDNTMTPLRRMMLQVAMTSTQTHLVLNTGSTVGIPMATPASAGATGISGTIAFDSNYVYACVSTNTWKRAPLASW